MAVPIVIIIEQNDPPATIKQKFINFWRRITDGIWGGVATSKYNVAQRAFTNLVASTPVDTGWARASWRASLDGSNMAMLPDPGGVSGYYAANIPEFTAPKAKNPSQGYIFTNDRKNIDIINSVPPHAGFIETALADAARGIKFKFE